MKTVGASRRIFYVKTPKDGRDGHTYSMVVSPSSVRVSAAGVVDPAVLANTTPAVTLYCDGEDVTSKANGLATAEYRVARKGVRLSDGVEEAASKTLIRDLAALYSSVRYEMLPSLAAIDGTVPVLASATLVFARQGAQGAQGATGAFVPPPMLWEDYPDGTNGTTAYDFKSGAEGDERLDIVLDYDVDGRLSAYRCKKAHTKLAAGTLRPLDDKKQKYWDAGSEFNYVATQVLLADTANIALTSTQAIRVYDNARNIVGEFSGAKEPKRILSGAVSGGPMQVASLAATDGATIQPGTGGTSAITAPVYLPLWLGGVMNEDGSFRKNPTFGVGTDGCMYLGGFNSGRRLIIDPNTTDADGKVSPTITLFNTDGERAVIIDGGRHEIGDVYDFTSNFTAAPSGDYKRITTEPRTDSLGTVRVGAAGGHIKASLEIAWHAESGYYIPAGSSSSGGIDTGGVSGGYIAHSALTASLAIINKTTGEQVAMSNVLSESGPGMLDKPPAAGNARYDSRNGTTTVSVEADLPEGEYELSLSRWIAVQSPNANLTLNPSLTILNAGSFNPAFSAGTDYKAFLGADGLLIAKSSTEYFRCGMVGGNLEVEANIGSHGIKVTRGGVYAKKSDGSWDSLLVACEKAAADANACVCDQLGTRMFTTNDSTANLPDKDLSGTNFGMITATTLNPQAGHHIQEWKTFTQPVHCWSRRCMDNTWGAWTKNY